MKEAGGVDADAFRMSLSIGRFSVTRLCDPASIDWIYVNMIRLADTAGWLDAPAADLHF